MFLTEFSFLFDFKYSFMDAYLLWQVNKEGYEFIISRRAWQI